jgi:hypothetical protein
MGGSGIEGRWARQRGANGGRGCGGNIEGGLGRQRWRRGWSGRGMGGNNDAKRGWR